MIEIIGLKNILRYDDWNMMTKLIKIADWNGYDNKTIVIWCWNVVMIKTEKYSNWNFNL